MIPESQRYSGKALELAGHAEKETALGNPRAGTSYALLAAFWQREAERAREREAEQELERHIDTLLGG